ncbi:MAG: phosphoglycolate phosphatase [Rhizobiaceae bacterium]|nr:phosphoglycolate phosphatase [Rhizobiaceae bacterium]
MTAPIIVFDLDGTLVDTAPDLLDSLNHTLATVDMEPVDGADIRRLVGMGAKVMIERAFEARQLELTKPTLAKLFDVFLEHYSANMPGRSRPYPGVPEALDRFSDAGFSFAVCTNKYEGMSVELLGSLGLRDRFKAICGQDTFAHRKPDPRHLTLTIEAAGGFPDRAIMVGDSETDIKTAIAAGIPVVAVDFGYTDRHVSNFDPSHVISHFDELTEQLVGRLLHSVAN